MTTAAAPLMYKIADLTGSNGLLRLSPSEVFKQIRLGLKTVKQGRATFITAADLEAYVELLRSEAEAAR